MYLWNPLELVGSVSLLGFALGVFGSIIPFYLLAKVYRWSGMYRDQGAGILNLKGLGKPQAAVLAVALLAWLYFFAFYIPEDSPFGYMTEPKKAWVFHSDICILDTKYRSAGRSGGKGATLSRVSCFDRSSGKNTFRKMLGKINDAWSVDGRIYFIRKPSLFSNTPEVESLSAQDGSVATVFDERSLDNYPELGGEVYEIKSSGREIIVFGNNKKTIHIALGDQDNLQKGAQQENIPNTRDFEMIPPQSYSNTMRVHETGINNTPVRQLLLEVQIETLSPYGPYTISLSEEGPPALWSLRESDLSLRDILRQARFDSLIRFAHATDDTLYLISSGYMSAIELRTGKIHWVRRM